MKSKLDHAPGSIVSLLCWDDDYVGQIGHTMGDDGKPSSWQWQLEVDGAPVVVEFLVNSDNPSDKGLVSLDGEEISACRSPYAGMTKVWFETHTSRSNRGWLACGK